jgi:GT2 family glycosyltransferase
MKVLFLILNYKTYQETIQLAEKLYEEGLNDKYILIVDNASPNDSFNEISKKVGRLKNVEVISSSENGGFAKGNNFGLRYAKRYQPEYVCIINNDVMFSMVTIDNLCKWYETLPNVAFIAPRQILPNGKEALFHNMDVPTIWSDLSLYNPFNRKFHYYVENSDIKGVNEIGIIPGAFTFTKYSIFERLGFFDEDTFLFCEERFIAKKAQMQGLKNYIILNETYLHAHSTTIKNEASEKRQRKMIFDGRCMYHRKYSSVPALSVGFLKAAYLLKEFCIYFKKNR